MMTGSSVSARLADAGYGGIATEIRDVPQIYFPTQVTSHTWPSTPTASWLGRCRRYLSDWHGRDGLKTSVDLQGALPPGFAAHARLTPLGLADGAMPHPSFAPLGGSSGPGCRSEWQFAA